jgi:hypothetical protein
MTRIGRSRIEYDRVSPEPHGQKKFLMAVGVAGVMLIVVGLYAASLRVSGLFSSAESGLPRWSIIREEVSLSTRPLAGELRELQELVVGALVANKVRAKTVELMKAKIGTTTSTEEIYAEEESGEETREEE